MLEENWSAVQLYLAVQTQWRVAGMGGVLIGLDYAAVDVVMRRLGFEDEAFRGMQVIERVVLSRL